MLRDDDWLASITSTQESRMNSRWKCVYLHYDGTDR